MPRREIPELSRAGWVRLQVLQNPTITLEELQKAYDKTDYPKKDSPKDKQVLYQASNQIRKRWGVNPADIPHKPDGQINLSAMVRLYLDRFGVDDPNTSAPIAFFASDGLELKAVTFSQVRGKYLTMAQEQPDANQDTGPRAGAPEPKKRRRRRRKVKPMDSQEVESHLDKFREIENRLDKLIVDAEAMKAWPLLNDLRNARRRAGAGVLAHS